MHIEYDSDRNIAPLPASHYLLCKGRELLAPLWVGLGAAETRLLRSRLQPVDRPLYVTGLARAGTTIMLTLLNRHPDVAAHRYRDMPQPFLPYVWNWLADRLPLSEEMPRERIHLDGMMVTRDSPEAVEEALWERFFSDLHDESRSAVLGADTRHPAFEACYRATIAKLLLARQRRRYLSKANYNLTRLAYLARIVPGARFVVMTRAPATHYASWLKQHALFVQTQERYPRWAEAIRLVGHCEFGHGNRFVHTNNGALTQTIRRAWDSGDSARAFGMYWSAMYGHVLDLVERDALVRDAVLFVRYEDLCDRPHETMENILAHVQLDASAFPLRGTGLKDAVAAPRYYRAQTDASEHAILLAATRETAARLGYA